MLIEEKSIHIKSWSEKFLFMVSAKSIKILLSSGFTSGVNKIPMQGEYENALEYDMDLNKKIMTRQV